MNVVTSWLNDGNIPCNVMQSNIMPGEGEGLPWKEGRGAQPMI